MWRHYVYRHIRNDTGEVFYIGKGSLRVNRKLTGYERAAIAHKNPAWRHVVQKAGGFSFEVIAHFATDADAQNHERLLIAAYGRRDLGMGQLVNFTDGGDGHAGIIASDSLRQKRRKNASAPRSNAWVAAIRLARKDGGNGGVVKSGDKLPATWRSNIAAGKMGARNPMFGRAGERHPNRREVMNIETGERWPTVGAAASAHGLKMKSLHNRLSGHRPNPSPLRFA